MWHAQVGWVMMLESTRLEEVCPRYEMQGKWVKPWGKDTGGARTVSKRVRMCKGACTAWAEAVKVDVGGGNAGEGRPQEEVTWGGGVG